MTALGLCAASCAEALCISGLDHSLPAIHREGGATPQSVDPRAGPREATMSLQQAAAHLRVTWSTILRLVDQGVLSAERAASRLLRPAVRDVERFGAERTALREKFARAATREQSTGLLARSPRRRPRRRCRAALRAFPLHGVRGVVRSGSRVCRGCRSG